MLIFMCTTGNIRCERLVDAPNHPCFRTTVSKRDDEFRAKTDSYPNSVIYWRCLSPQLMSQWLLNHESVGLSKAETFLTRSPPHLLRYRKTPTSAIQPSGALFQPRKQNLRPFPPLPTRLGLCNPTAQSDRNSGNVPCY